MKTVDEQIAEIWASMAERERIAKEAKIEAVREAAEEEAKRKKIEEKRKKEFDEMVRSIKELRKENGGISDSNGKFSETYFYNTLTNTMRFGGLNFDEIDKGLTRARKMPDGNFLRAEYDVIMYNGNAIALIEIKYKVRKDDIEDLVTKKIETFKILFPQFANYAFYLGIAGLSFEKGTETDAKKHGIGILRPKGESVEIIDAHIRAY